MDTFIKPNPRASWGRRASDRVRPEDLITGEGEMAVRMRAKDWSSSPVGPIESWPIALRTLVRMLLHSRQPMFLFWGPELTQFYNDAYLPSFGKGKHPRALGQSGRECWATIGPQIENAMQRGIPSWNENQRVPMLRNGQTEEAYWTYGYSPVFDDDGNIAGTLVTCTETTREVLGLRAHQLARNELERARLRLKGLFENAPAFVCTLEGPQHVFSMVNAPYQRLMGQDRVLLGKAVRDAVPEAEAQGFLKLLDGVYRTGTPFTGSETLLRMERNRTGVLEDVFVTFVYQPRFALGGQVEGIDVFGFEVTEHVETRRLAQAAEKTSRALAEAIPQQVWTANAQGALDFVNQRVLDYFWATREQVLGNRWIEGVHPDDTAQASASWQRSVSTGDDYEVEFRLRGGDGTYRWHLSRALAVRDSQGKIVHWFGTNTDIDDAKRIREELLLRTEFEQQLVGIVSHDLRNPLSAMLTTASMLLRRDETDERTAKALSRIMSSGDRAARMIRDLLDFTEARLGKGIPIQPQPLDLHALVEQVVEEAQIAHLDRDIRLQREGDGRTEGDSDRLAQVVSNLLNNALQYSPPGSPVEVKTGGDERGVSIEIRNQGDPIPSSLLSSLFQPMKRGSTLSNRSSRSIGLGLFIVEQLVRSHGGTIEVRSTAATGTSFIVRLPHRTPALPKA